MSDTSPATSNTVPCGWCKTPTAMTGTERCDRCWELERRIQADLQLARRMLASFTEPSVWRLRAEEVGELRTTPSAIVAPYGCGTFDAQGLCDNCRKKISDLNDGAALCPFGAYPKQSASESTSTAWRDQVEGAVWDADHSGHYVLARDMATILDRQVAAVEWLNGAQVDEHGRLILTRDYIVRCLSEHGKA